MESYDYLELLASKWKKESKEKKLTFASPVTLDWGELEFVFNHVHSYEKLLLLAKMFYHETKDQQIRYVIQEIVSNSTNEHFLTNAYYSESEVGNCYICKRETKLTRSEQLCMIDDEKQMKCLDCLVTQYKDTNEEIQQLMEYRLFVKEKNLEEQFEYFSQERKSEFFN